MQCPHQGIFRNFTWRERANIFNLPLFTTWELPWIAPDSSGSWVGHYLEHIRYTVTALTKPLHFKGSQHPCTCHPIQVLWWLLFLCTQSAASTSRLLEFIHELGHHLCYWQEVSVPYELRHDIQWGLPQALAGKHKCFFVYRPYKSLSMFIYALASHCSNCRDKPFRTA